MSSKVQIVEVGLRDGLQNEKLQISPQLRIQAAQKLSQAGFRRLEIGAFVRPDKVPQMANSGQVIEAALQLQKQKKISKDVQFSALVPNEKGMEEALKYHLPEIAIFLSASEAFSKSNINCSIEEGFARAEAVIKMAKKNKIKVRGYLSVCFGCPYEGEVAESQVVKFAHRLHEMGCYEISIGDTIGVASPKQVTSLFKKLSKKIPVKKLAGHFHDTRGAAVANILAAYNVGVRTFDTSLGGLGGCPYAPGSSGNVATEDVVYMFEKMGVATGIDLAQTIEINHWLSAKMGKPFLAKVSSAGLLKL